MLGAIGRTPIVKVEQLVEPGMAEVWVKLESANPTGRGGHHSHAATEDDRALARDRRGTGGYANDQFGNHDMIDGYGGMGAELLEQLGGRVDAFCAYVETAGCFTGVNRRLPAALPSGGSAGTHRIEGSGRGFWPPLFARDDFDEVVTVSTADAFAMARRAAREEGLRSGPSTVDSGLKYLAGDLQS